MAIKRIVVTGGNKGIGKALCQKLLQDYGDVHVFLGSRDESRGKDAVANIIEHLGGDSASRIEYLHIDVTSEESIKKAAEFLSTTFGFSSLYAVVNNAAVGFGQDLEHTLRTNVYGPYHITNYFLPLLARTSDPNTTGRIVNISSGVAPNYVAKLDVAEISSKVFTDPSSTWDQLVARMDEEIAAGDEKDAYGLSKACLNAYTVQTSLLHPDLLVNSCSPGFIDTDLTKGYGAKLTPEQGTVSALHCLFGADIGTGKYFGSDALRSPLNKYRAPGDAPYEP